MKKLLFLDIDGVFLVPGEKAQFANKLLALSRLERFKLFVDIFRNVEDLEIWVHSAWGSLFPDVAQWKEILFPLKVSGVCGPSRDTEIRRVLEEQRPDKYVILDDGFVSVGNLVRTNSMVGLTDENMHQILYLLGEDLPSKREWERFEYGETPTVNMIIFTAMV